ncbi:MULTISPECIES: histidine phosphatase family protein [Cupriavidus]|uniref:Phosphoglycerate/bisphosphoglycerate mutase n=1 Tax=Cupriavidus pinatubonensis (strain JMP 134 / LMG 1197) TaxID=264198 RepID=Q474Z1_CUPPJ|nr:MULTISPECIES: histidine phosphatase family protein [Cupriavidus]QYY32253.1 histidine phosphatase family protein [Cupriavidus pinatubonensis]
MDVVLIRHARPQVGGGICYGSLDLCLMTPVEPSPGAIVAALPTPQRVLTSPLRRAAETTRLLMQSLPAHTLEPEVEPRLAEIDFGAWEGRAWDDIPRGELDALAQDLLDACPHGGETAALAMARVSGWAASLAEAAPTDTCLWVVGHAGPMRLLAAHWLGLSLATTLGWELGFGASCLFRLGSGTPQLAWWNRSAG